MTRKFVFISCVSLVMHNAIFSELKCGEGENVEILKRNQILNPQLLQQILKRKNEISRNKFIFYQSKITFIFLARTSIGRGGAKIVI